MISEKPTCTKCLVCTTFGLFKFSALSIFKKSTQKEVVSAVKAESVVANVAAVNPSKKIIEGTIVKWLKAISGKSKSVRGFPVTKSNGTSIPFLAANKYSNAPTLKKKILMNTNMAVKLYMFF